jgi:formylglycine-generating enzyme required for sulfatase activity/tRNA A-37 threonylcarbamoyl transferase component Bud32
MSTAADPVAGFLAALQASRLLANEQMQDIAAWAAQHRPDVPTLAKEINRRGWLTVYQIKEIARGRGAGLLLNNYIIQDLLGEGGMGRVYKAHNTRLGRDEALKLIRGDKLKHPSARARFTLEMQALGKLKHPNVVTAFDAGPLGDLHFVSMELIDGIDLTRMVRDRGPMPFPFACECIRQACLGLQHAFELGMVHRDIKPSNILVTRDGKQVKLVDLGLARINDPINQEGANRVTQEGFVIGTPDFLAPEQARNPAGVDIRADIYALGATLYFILTGRVPYDGANATEKLMKHCTEPPPRLLQHRPDLPPQLEQLIHWCMAKRPEDRPQSPVQLAVTLQPFCPAPPPGTGVHRVSPPSGFLPPLVKDANSSSQVFKLPAQDNDSDPIRRRAKGGFPWAFVLIGLGILGLAGILAYAGYLAMKPVPLPPVESFTNTAEMKMVKIEGGTFEMGSPAKEPGRPEPKPRQPDDESPVHTVTIRGPFLISATEVTVGQYLRVMNQNPAQSAVVKRAKDPGDHPVDFVSYEDAMEFCKKLGEKDAEKKAPHLRPGWAYRLPTEAEWEYCCRAGTNTPYHFGDKINNIPKLGGEGQPGGRFLPTGEEKELDLEGANLVKDSAIEDIPGRVAQFQPNAWGLYDMHGNAAEWCLDWYRRGYPGTEPRDNPTGPATGERRVVRGGSFRDPASACRSAARTALSPTEKRATIGFRIVYAPIMK